MAIRILVVDDHEIVRQGLRVLFGSDSEFEIVGAAADGAEAISMARTLRPDVVLMDVRMPRVGGIEATARICDDLPDTRVVALTGDLDCTTVVEMVRAGAIGCLLKEISGDDLLRSVRSAATGRMPMAPSVTACLMRELHQPTNAERLTKREFGVLQLVALGESNYDIARSLAISEKTVKTHVSNILSKLNATSRTQAVAHAVQAGLAISRS